MNKEVKLKPESADFSLGQWLTVLAVMAVTVLYKPFWPAVLELLQNEWVKPIALASFAAFVSWKWSVCYFERFRPFDDGDEKTPDPCLRNPGDGSGAYFMAFLPGVILYRFWKTPLSWLLGKSKRHIVRIYPDGSVGFDWVPIVLIAKWWLSGQLTFLPVGYCLPAKIMDRLRNRFNAYDGPVYRLPEKEQHFVLFVGWLLKNHIIQTEPYSVPAVSPNAVRISRSLDQLNQTVAGMDLIGLVGAVNNLATSANSFGSRVTNGSKRLEAGLLAMRPGKKKG